MLALKYTQMVLTSSCTRMTRFDYLQELRVKRTHPNRPAEHHAGGGKNVPKHAARRTKDNASFVINVVFAVFIGVGLLIYLTWMLLYALGCTKLESAKEASENNLGPAYDSARPSNDALMFELFPILAHLMAKCPEDDAGSTVLKVTAAQLC